MDIQNLLSHGYVTFQITRPINMILEQQQMQQTRMQTEASLKKHPYSGASYKPSTSVNSGRLNDKSVKII